MSKWDLFRISEGRWMLKIPLSCFLWNKPGFASLPWFNGHVPQLYVMQTLPVTYTVTVLLPILSSLIFILVRLFRAAIKTCFFAYPHLPVSNNEHKYVLCCFPSTFVLWESCELIQSKYLIFETVASKVSSWNRPFPWIFGKNTIQFASCSKRLEAHNVTLYKRYNKIWLK